MMDKATNTREPQVLILIATSLRPNQSPLQPEPESHHPPEISCQKQQRSIRAVEQGASMGKEGTPLCGISFLCSKTAWILH